MKMPGWSPFSPHCCSSSPACGRPRTLFRYRPRPVRNGRGTTVIGARLVDAVPARAGLEIRLQLVQFAGADSRPRLVRRYTRLYAYDPAPDRYVPLPRIAEPDALPSPRAPARR